MTVIIKSMYCLVPYIIALTTIRLPVLLLPPVEQRTYIKPHFEPSIIYNHPTPKNAVNFRPIAPLSFLILFTYKNSITFLIHLCPYQPYPLPLHSPYHQSSSLLIEALVTNQNKILWPCNIFNITQVLEIFRTSYQN